ncbi:MAG: hypothetical protein KDA80_00860 [Planctomycetaceae bacterium]|nr:hypothetical protein [Planctomycetaceae bacterium]
MNSRTWSLVFVGVLVTLSQNANARLQYDMALDQLLETPFGREYGDIPFQGQPTGILSKRACLRCHDFTHSHPSPYDIRNEFGSRFESYLDGVDVNESWMIQAALEKSLREAIEEIRPDVTQEERYHEPAFRRASQTSFAIKWFAAFGIFVGWGGMLQSMLQHRPSPRKVSLAFAIAMGFLLLFRLVT